MKRLEYTLHTLILLSLAVLYIIIFPQHSLLFNIHFLIFLSGSSFLFYSQAFWLVPKQLLSRRYKKYIVFSLSSSIVCVLIRDRTGSQRTVDFLHRPRVSSRPADVAAGTGIRANRRSLSLLLPPRPCRPSNAGLQALRFPQSTGDWPE